MSPLDFLNLLWECKPEDLYLLIWTLQDKQSHWFQDIGAAAEFVLRARGLDVYVGVSVSKKNLGPNRRCMSEASDGISSLWSDLDLKSPAHRKPLPGTIPDALSIIPATMPPSVVVSTGNGAHAWWLFKEPYIFESGEERKRTARIVSRWHTLLRLNAATRGWAYDPLPDLARVLRIPGTLNYKDPQNPKDVALYSFTDRRYNLSDFEEFLDDAAIPDAEAQEQAAREWAERFADKPLVISPGATIPQDLIDAWMRIDMRFKNTWLRQRHDLRDQSQSGYDLALADFGVTAGLSEQQVVDLIVHHRSLYSQKQRTRIDYFQRTISTASRRNIGGAVIAPPTPVFPARPAADATTGPAAPQGAPVAPGEPAANVQATPDPSRAKALLCQHISTVLGIQIVRLVKITGKEPTYHMELEEGGKIEFTNVGKLISQDSVRVAIAAALGKLIRKVKAKDWEQLAQSMLDACFVEEGSVEAEWEGAARTYVAQYLAETGFIESIDSQTVQNQRKPMVLEGKVAVNASDLQIYVNRTTFQNLSVKAVASMLAAMGGRQVRVRGAKFKEQSRWMLPVEEFDPVEYAQPGSGASF